MAAAWLISSTTETGSHSGVQRILTVRAPTWRHTRQVVARWPMCHGDRMQAWRDRRSGKSINSKAGKTADAKGPSSEPACEAKRVFRGQECCKSFASRSQLNTHANARPSRASGWVILLAVSAEAVQKLTLQVHRKQRPRARKVQVIPATFPSILSNRPFLAAPCVPAVLNCH